MRIKGFTLIELLAVIVVLAIIALIAVPLILNIIEKAKKGAFQDSAYGIAKAAEYVFVETALEGHAKDQEFIYSNFEESNDDNLTLKYNGAKPEFGVVTLKADGSVSLLLWRDGYCAVKGENESQVFVDKKTWEDCEQADLPPVIEFTGYANNVQVELTMMPGDELGLPGVTAFDSSNNELTNDIQITNNVDENTPGTYTVVYTVTDSNNNTTTRTIKVIVQDNIPPVVNFTPNGDNAWSRDVNVVVNITDDSEINNSSLKYLWSTSTNLPGEETFTEGFNNGGVINENNLTGIYYLWIIAKDIHDNTTITRSESFNIDNTSPDISNMVVSTSDITETSFTITRTGDAIDLDGGLQNNPYIFQTSLDGENWINNCITNQFNCEITNLSSGDGRYYRVCVVDNVLNSNCSPSKVASTIETLVCGEDLIDSRDNQVYKTVLIGNQCWMAENLRYTENGCLNELWSTTLPYNACNNHTPSWLGAKEEVLYQWGSAMDGETVPGSQGICPAGWYIPSDEDWIILEGTVDSLHGVEEPGWSNSGWRGSDVGKKLKSSVNWNGTDDFGFNALPIGYRNPNGALADIDHHTIWWSSTPSATNAFRRSVDSSFNSVYRNGIGQSYGFAIRCIME